MVWRSPRACQAPLLAMHVQLAQTPRTPAPAALTDAQPIVRGRAPVARISYYGMEMSQVQTARPGCEHPLPSAVFHPGAPSPRQAAAPSPPPSAWVCPQACRDGAAVRAVSQKLGRDVCVCVYLCVCCAHVCVHMYVCTCTCGHGCACSVFAHAHVCEYMSLCLCVRARVCTHVCLCSCSRVRGRDVCARAPSWGCLPVMNEH